MKTFYCCGFYPLIFLLSSNKLNKNDKVIYILYKEDNWEDKNILREPYFVQIFCKIFKIEYTITDLITKYTKPIFMINNGDYISENLLHFLKNDINEKKIICIPEGSSGLKHLFFDLNWLKFEVLNNRFLEYIIFDDFDSIIYKKRKYNVEVVPYNLIKSGLLKISNYFNHELKYDFDQITNLFCPFLLEDLDTQKEILLNSLNPKDTIHIKKHPSDFRDYSIFENDLRFTILNGDYELIPAELFFLNTNTNYWGFYSTVILSVSFNKINIIDCNSKMTINYLNNEARYLYKIFKARAKKRKYLTH
jgi:hypothetical protein